MAPTETESLGKFRDVLRIEPSLGKEDSPREIECR